VNTTSILGAISATGLINVSLRAPKPIKKGKLGCTTDVYGIETVTGYCPSALKATLDEMDKYPEMKGDYLDTNSAPIHSSTDIENIFTFKSIGMYIFFCILLN
jgi:hypothetical protein